MEAWGRQLPGPGSSRALWSSSGSVRQLRCGSSLGTLTTPAPGQPSHVEAQRVLGASLSLLGLQEPIGIDLALEPRQECVARYGGVGATACVTGERAHPTCSDPCRVLGERCGFHEDEAGWSPTWSVTDQLRSR